MGRIVEVVRKDVESHMSDDLRDLVRTESRLPHRFKINVRDLPSGRHDLPRKRERRGVFGGFRPRFSRLFDLCIRQSSEFADGGVRRYAFERIA